MFTIPEQPSEEPKPKFESLGPHFFSRIFKEEEGGRRSDAPSATLYDIYHIELSATALGMDRIIISGLRICADLGAAGFLDAEKDEQGQQTTVGSATVAMTETRFKDSEDVYRSCTIEQLNVETGNILTNMEAFATMLRRIQSFCIKYHAEHLAMAPAKGSCWFSSLLKSAGFKICDCERLDNHVDAGFQLCVVLPTPPVEKPAEEPVEGPAEEPAKEPSIKTGKRRRQESGPVTERSPLNKPSLPKRQKTGASPAAAEELTSPEGSPADSPQPRDRSPFGVQALIDSIKNEPSAPSKTINTPPPATSIARMPVFLPKKEYCMYWIRRGECDYMQSGCRYKHEMPVDEETRQRIGLREIPGWFKESPDYEQFLFEGNRSATGTSTGVGSRKRDLFRALSSDRGSGRDRIGRVAMIGRPPSSHAVQSLHEDHHHSTEAKTPRDGPLSAPKINSTNAVKRTADRRFDRGIYKPPGAKRSSGRDDMRAATRESSKFQRDNSEGSSRGQARSGGEVRIKGAGSTHSGVFK